MFVDFLFRAVHFTQQQCLGVTRIPRLGEVIGRDNGVTVHHLQSTGDDAMGNDTSHGIAGLLHTVETCHHHLGNFRFGQQFDLHFGNDTQQAFRPGHQRQQVHSTGIQRVIADGHPVTLGRDHLHAENVMNRQTVFQAMHTARVLRHVATNGAGNLRRRIRAVIETKLGNFLADRQVTHTRLQQGRSRQRINVQDAVELGQRQHHAFLVRHGTGTQARSGTTGHHGHFVLVADAHHSLHLFGDLRQHHEHRHLAVHRHAVAFIGLHGFVIGDDEVRVYERTELFRQLRCADFRFAVHIIL